MAIASRLNTNGNLQVSGSFDEITNNPSTFGSFYYTTVNNYLSVPAATAGSKYDFGTSDFTVECWVYGLTIPSSTSGYNLIMASANTLTWELLTYNSQLYWHQAGGNFLFGGTITYAQWNHFAAVRIAGTLTLYINGVSVGSKADSYSYAGQATRIFGPNGGTAGFYMTNIRIINGTGVYTGNFTPPGNPLTASTNTALLLNSPTIPSANSFLDGSTNNVTLTKTGTVNTIFQTPLNPNGYYDYYFNNAGPDYIMAPTNASYNLTSGDWTIECWVYGLGIGAAQFGIVTVTDTTNAGTNGTAIFLDTSNRIGFFVNGSAGTVTYSGNNIILSNIWYHVALVRSGSTNTLYVNGVSVATNSVTPTNSTTPPVGIGRLYNDNTTLTWSGYISNLRIVKGTAVYTSGPFTPPSSRLTAIPNTVLLTCQSNRIVDNSTIAATLTRTGGSAVTSNIIPFSSYIYSGSNVAVQRVNSTGTLQITGIFDEVTINGGSVAQRINPNGNLQVSGVFDEYNKPV